MQPPYWTSGPTGGAQQMPADYYPRHYPTANSVGPDCPRQSTNVNTGSPVSLMRLGDYSQAGAGPRSSNPSGPPVYEPGHQREVVGPAHHSISPSEPQYATVLPTFAQRAAQLSPSTSATTPGNYRAYPPADCHPSSLGGRTAEKYCTAVTPDATVDEGAKTQVQPVNAPVLGLGFIGPYSPPRRPELPPAATLTPLNSYLTSHDSTAASIALAEISVFNRPMLDHNIPPALTNPHSNTTQSYASNGRPARPRPNSTVVESSSVNRRYAPKNGAGRYEFFGHEWYWRIVMSRAEAQTNTRRAASLSLMDRFSPEYLLDRFIVCYASRVSPETGSPLYIAPKPTDDPTAAANKTVKLYAVFDSYIEFFDYMRAIRVERQGFFEIIMGARAQKPHFDVDISAETFATVCSKVFDPDPVVNLTISAEWIKDTLLRSITTVLAHRRIILDFTRDVLVFTSHAAHKRSYHIVINNYAHPNHEEARAFYEVVMSVFAQVCPYTQFVDPYVYSRLQQFRLVGSQKWGSHRPKQFLSTFTYFGDTYHHIIDNVDNRRELLALRSFSASLVSFTSGCTLLPRWAPERPSRFAPLGSVGPAGAIGHRTIELLITPAVQERCLTLMEAKMDGDAFEFVEVNDLNHLTFRRKYASLCPVCARSHSSNNPFIMIRGNRVYWNCRAHHERRSLLLGPLDPARTLDGHLPGGTALGPPKEPPAPPLPNFGFNFAPPELPEEDEDWTGWNEDILAGIAPGSEYTTSAAALPAVALEAGLPKFAQGQGGEAPPEITQPGTLTTTADSSVATEDVNLLQQLEDIVIARARSSYATPLTGPHRYQ